jgi:hypothetical protein
MVADGIQVLGTDKAVEALDESVVQNEHDGRKIPSPLGVPEQHLSNITSVLDFRVSKTELPIKL